MLKKLFYIIIGSFLIAAALVFFLIPYEIISMGVFGIGTLIYYQFGIIPPLAILTLNMSFLAVACFFLDVKKIKEYLWPLIVIPSFAMALS